MREGMPEPGDVIADKYRVERVVGRGGMGTVFAVSHQRTGKKLALKCLLPSLYEDASSVERFTREARAVGYVHHRHVIDVFDVGSDGPLHFLVMPLLTGKSLTDLLAEPELPLADALMVLVRAMEGVAAAHACGIVHRDLKPCNIFVCPGMDGRLDDPRVLDFGISKLPLDEATRLTKSGMALGTPYYMALEQMTGRRDIDHRADIYSMGVILYEAISGRLPHLADNVASLAIERMYTEPAQLDTLRPDLPAGLSSIVQRALARDPADRYDSMQALADEVRSFVQSALSGGRTADTGVELAAGPPKSLTAGRRSASERTQSYEQAASMSDAGRAPASWATGARPSDPVASAPWRPALIGAGVVFVLGGAALLAYRANEEVASPLAAPYASPSAVQPSNGPQVAEAVSEKPREAGTAITDAAAVDAAGASADADANDLGPKTRPWRRVGNALTLDAGAPTAPATAPVAPVTAPVAPASVPAEDTGELTPEQF